MVTLVNKVAAYCYNKSVGLLLIRAAVGIVFLMQGYMKMQQMAAVEAFFVSSLHLPSWVAIAITLLEVVGGLALILGIATRVFGVLFAIEMLVAIFLTGFMGAGFSYAQHELEIMLVMLSLGIVAVGSGKWSLYPLECRKCGGMFCDGGENCPKHDHRDHAA